VVDVRHRGGGERLVVLVSTTRKQPRGSGMLAAAPSVNNICCRGWAYDMWRGEKNSLLFLKRGGGAGWRHQAGGER
jgi:hypothetical protein